MEEFSKTNCTDLINLWIDINRPKTQWVAEGQPGEWNVSVNYNKCVENIENALHKKLNISMLEVKIFLNSKKAVVDAKEMSLFNTKKRKSQDVEKTNKYINKLARSMGEMNQVILEAHHSVCKLEGIHEEEK